MTNIEALELLSDNDPYARKNVCIFLKVVRLCLVLDGYACEYFHQFTIYVDHRGK